MDLDTDLNTKRQLAFNGPRIIIVEGVLLFKRGLRDWFHLKIWINISFETAMMRILQRSRDQRYGDTNAIRAPYETRFFLAQRHHLLRDDPANSADIVFTPNNTIR